MSCRQKEFDRDYYFKTDSKCPICGAEMWGVIDPQASETEICSNDNCHYFKGIYMTYEEMQALK